MKIAIWCRHKGDSIIGIGPHIPWHISSDFKRFKRLTLGKNIVVGQATYESLPNKTLSDRKIYVLTFDKNYKVSDENNHFIVNDMTKLSSLDDDLYICGGASIYKAFFSNSYVLPECVIDCVYMGDIDESLEGNKVSVNECVKVMEKYYTPHIITTEDNVQVIFWTKYGLCIPKEDLESLINKILGK